MQTGALRLCEQSRLACLCTVLVYKILLSRLHLPITT